MEIVQYGLIFFELLLIRKSSVLVAGIIDVFYKKDSINYEGTRRESFCRYSCNYSIISFRDHYERCF